MTTSAAACGTNSGYQRHHARGEDPCEECRAAHAEYRAGLRQREKLDRAATFAEALAAEPPINIDEWDELADHRENMRYVQEAMLNPSMESGGFASLARVRVKLSAVIAEEQRKRRHSRNVTPLDEILERRARRQKTGK